MRSVTPFQCGTILPHSPFLNAIEIACHIVSTSLQTTPLSRAPRVVRRRSLESSCNYVVNHPQSLLAEPRERRCVLLTRLMALRALPRRSSAFANSPDVLKIHGLASAALTAYVKAGLQAGKFAPKLRELLDLGLDPFFQWQEQGVSTNLLDAVIHHAASDCALLLAQRGVGHGYLSHPFPEFGGNPRFLPQPPTRFGNQRGLVTPPLAELNNPRQFSGRSIAHTLLEVGSLNEIVLAANSGLIFSHSASNMPHPLVFAVLNLNSDAVHYLISNEDSLGTVAALCQHIASRDVLEQAKTAGNPLANFLSEYARKAYPRLFAG